MKIKKNARVFRTILMKEIIIIIRKEIKKNQNNKEFHEI